MRVAAVLGPCCRSPGSTTCLKLLQKWPAPLLLEFTKFVVGRWVLLVQGWDGKMCALLSQVSLRVGERVVVCKLISDIVSSLQLACWSACCLQAHVSYVVKFVAHLALLQPHVARLLELSWGKGLVADLWNDQTLVWHFTTLLRGREGTKQKPWFLYDKIAHFGGTSFSAAKSLKNGAVPHITSPVAMGMVFGTWRTCFEKAGWLSKPRSSSQFCAKGRPKIGSARRPQFWSRAICAELKLGPSGGPSFGPPFAQICELERGFDNQPAFSKHVLQVPKTIPMATGEVTFLRRSLGHGFRVLNWGRWAHVFHGFCQMWMVAAKN